MRRLLTWMACFAVLAVLVPAVPPALAAPPASWDKKIDGKGRFKVLKKFDGKAVLDKETGLVWTRGPRFKGMWVSGVACSTAHGNRGGWRGPSVSELTTLIDRSQSNPALPPGHPFDQGFLPSGFCWTATTYAGDPTKAWVVNLDTGIGATSLKTGQNLIWCVRAPGGTDGGH